MAGRYAHAKQFKRHNRELKFLRTRLGRMIRDIRRKTEGRWRELLWGGVSANWRLERNWQPTQ